jgi:hypothetical protein
MHPSRSIWSILSTLSFRTLSWKTQQATESTSTTEATAQRLPISWSSAASRCETSALRGEIKQFTGVSDPYWEPLPPEVTVETDKESVEESTAKIMRRLELMGYI